MTHTPTSPLFPQRDTLSSRRPPATGRAAAEAALAEGSRRLYAPRREAQVLALRLARRAG